MRIILVALGFKKELRPAGFGVDISFHLQTGYLGENDLTIGKDQATLKQMTSISSTIFKPR